MNKNKEKHHVHEGAEKKMQNAECRMQNEDGDKPTTDAGCQTPRDEGQAPDLSRAARDARPAKAGIEEDGGKQTPDAGPARNATHSVAGGRQTTVGDEALPATTAPAEAADQDAKLAQLQDRLLRLQADFDNFRKRTLREKNELFDSANQALMLELLPVLDHLHLGIQAASAHQADPAFREGLTLIFDQLMGVLSKFGLSPMETEKQVYDPNRFESVNALPSATEPEGTVLAAVRRGYMLRNKLLRPAQVIVASGPPQEEMKNVE